MKKLLTFSICLMVGFLCEVSAQVRTISGVVYDDANITLPGANVMVKNTNNGTMTDIDGKFSIQVAEGDILMISYIGFETKEITIKKQNKLSIILSANRMTMEETVVIGYGTQKKSDITGSIERADMGEMSKSVVRSFDEALAGRVAGVQVSSSEGGPNGKSTIIIRGGNSLTQSNEPLYVVDGIPMTDFDISSISNNEIESMDILKDASATAIYGARGANGVIIITTKRGTQGAPKISYDGNIGFNFRGKQMEVMTPYEFVDFQKDWGFEHGHSEMYDRYTTKKDMTLEDYKDVEGFDWQGKVIRKAVPITSHSLTVNGGTKTIRYSGSFSYFNQQGNMKNSKFERFNGRMTLDANLSKSVKIGMSAAYTRGITTGESPSMGNFNASRNIFYSTWAYPPIPMGEGFDFTGGEDEGVGSTSDFRYNPILTLENQYRKNIKNNLSANAYFQWSIIKDLVLKSTFSYTDISSRFEGFNNSHTAKGDPRLNQNGVNGNVNFDTKGNFVNENTLKYTYDKNHIRFSAMVGASFQIFKRNVYGYGSVHIPHENLGMSGIDTGTVTSAIAQISDWTQESYFTRIEGDFLHRYLITATFRADGSSKFPPKNRWGYFPSVALGWRLSNEPFIEKLHVFDDFKIRFSWGQTGNNSVGDYAWRPVVMVNDGTLIGYPFDGVIMDGSIIGIPENNKLKWETTDQFNLGLDLAFFNNRLSGTLDLYAKKTHDLLMNANVAPSLGFTRQFLNIGEIENKGIELTLRGVPIKKAHFKWDMSFNIAFNRNKILALTRDQNSMISTVKWGGDPSPCYISQVGKPAGLMYGWIWEGNYQHEDFTIDSKGNEVLKPDVPRYNDKDIKPGYIKYKDLNGDNIIDTKDRTIIGNGNPIHIGGFSNNFKIYDFDLSIFFQWSYGNDIMNANRMVMDCPVSHNHNGFKTATNRWTENNQNNEIYRIGGEGPSGFSSRTVEDGSFLRLKMVSLGYNFNKKLLSKTAFKQIRLYLSANNIFTIDNYSGYDPEVSVRHSAMTPGFDYSSAPRGFAINFGVKLTL